MAKNKNKPLWRRTAEPLLWACQLFTKSKSFRANPLIGSPILNRLGLHVARVCLAHAVFRARAWPLSPLVPADQRRRYLRQGHLVLENMLPADEFEALRAEVHGFAGQVREYIEGDTRTHFVLLDDDALTQLPVCRSLLRRKDYRRLHKFCGSTNKYAIFFLQKIINNSGQGRTDPQKTLHADTFHPSMKSWLYLQDVDGRDGPLIYFPGSQRLTWRRIVWEYRRSLIAKNLKDGHSENGSFRATREDLAVLGLPDPVALIVPANSLVIANTFGFHCRGQAAPGRTRREVWCYSRVNPFNPLPGVDWRPLNRLRYRVYQAYWRYRDRQAAAAGRRAYEHLTDLPFGCDDVSQRRLQRPGRLQEIGVGIGHDVGGKGQRQDQRPFEDPAQGKTAHGDQPGRRDPDDRHTGTHAEGEHHGVEEVFRQYGLREMLPGAASGPQHVREYG
jgi:hypothetical protein